MEIAGSLRSEQETAALTPSSWRGLAPPSTSSFVRASQDVDGRPPAFAGRAGHPARAIRASPNGTPLHPRSVGRVDGSVAVIWGVRALPPRPSGRLPPGVRHDQYWQSMAARAAEPDSRADAEAAASPAVVSVNVSSSTISQPWLTANAQAVLKSGIFQSPISEVTARSSRVSVPPMRQRLPYTTICNSRRPISSGVCFAGCFRAIRDRSIICCWTCSPMSLDLPTANSADQ